MLYPTAQAKVEVALAILGDEVAEIAGNQWFVPGGERQYLQVAKRSLLAALEAVNEALVALEAEHDRAGEEDGSGI